MPRRIRKHHIQLTLERARTPDGRHGGWRPRAGRPAKPSTISHATRPDEPARFPRHVTLRVVDGVPSLAREGVMKVIRAAIRDSQRPRARVGHRPRGMARDVARGMASDVARVIARDVTSDVACNVSSDVAPGIARDVTSDVPHDVPSGIACDLRRDDFRIVEFNVLGNHVHLLAEAASKEALASGIAGLEIRLARRVNALLGRRGKLFPHRYHARALKTPREVRHAIRYVLLNRKHHAAEKRYGAAWIDACSSAPWFTGWAAPIRADEPWKRELLALPQPTEPPETWLLAVGWKRHGLLRFDERPG